MKCKDFESLTEEELNYSVKALVFEVKHKPVILPSSSPITHLISVDNENNFLAVNGFEIQSLEEWLNSKGRKK